MEFVVEDAPKKDCPKGVVVNMSLGGGFSQALNDAADAITKAGIFLAVAAGNEGADASTSSPASAESACTVGATDKTDGFASFSNFGELVDVLAPGVAIESVKVGGGSTSLSGTSMASPTSPVSLPTSSATAPPPPVSARPLPPPPSRMSSRRSPAVPRTCSSTTAHKFSFLYSLITG
uniref:Peptidase S8/S53 domain-containing protein n=1 Tax=Bionectria ochroleuca TaxID=29856 RepID=A0A8H7KC05_BIOOC